MADRYLCRVCYKTPTATKNHHYRTHSNGREQCEMSSEPIPEGLEPCEGSPEVPEEGKDFSKCPHCARRVKLTRLGYFEPHDMTLRGGDRCRNSGVRFQNLKPVQEVPLPGDEIPDKGVYSAQRPTVTAQMEVAAAYTEPAGSTHPVVAAAIASGAVSPNMIDLAALNLQRQPHVLAVEATGEAGDGASGAPVTVNASTDAPAETKGSSEWPAPAASSGASTGSNSPGLTSTSESSAKSSDKSGPNDTPTSSNVSHGPFRLGKVISEMISQPWSPFLQPPEWTGSEKPDPMAGGAVEIATRFKEIFYSHSNRRTADNRSAQTTLGPSEIGTPCDRRLAMALMGIEPVNPGGDGWAAWVGTQGHAGLEQVFKWASANTGRFVTEVRLNLPSRYVPRGTSDLFDRVHGEVWDFKFMGAYSLKKFKLEGPSETYRIQGHVYGLGQELAGEKVRKIAILGLPRAGSSLNEMHVWEEKFDKKVALAALARVDAIAAKVVEIRRLDGLGSMPSPMATAKTFSTADDCRYCPFHLKNDKEMTRGCSGS